MSATKRQKRTSKKQSNQLYSSFASCQFQAAVKYITANDWQRILYALASVWDRTTTIDHALTAGNMKVKPLQDYIDAHLTPYLEYLLHILYPL